MALVLAQTWKRTFNELRQDPQVHHGEVHALLANVRDELLLEPSQLNRYVVLPVEPLDLYCMAAECSYTIARPGHRERRGDGHVSYRAVSFDRRTDLVLDEDLAHDLCAALNAGRLNF